MKKMGLLVLVFFATSFAYAQDQGKIAVASKGRTPTAEVSGVAARSPYFLIFDRSGTLLEAADNPHKTARRGAGASVVRFLAEKGVSVVVAGKFGQRMVRTMKERNMEYMAFQGNAEGAVRKVLEPRE
jgi:predicted Fe-Mo cluster-binding NifX family protein